VRLRDTATATKSGDEPASMRVGHGGEFDRDCNRPAVAPFTKTVQAICKIFERSVLRHHERNRVVFERHRHAARPRLILMDIQHRFLVPLSARNPANAPVEQCDDSWLRGSDGSLGNYSNCDEHSELA
jgi:hypothetical protein